MTRQQYTRHSRIVGAILEATCFPQPEAWERWEKCPECKGVEGTPWRCSYCGGAGWFETDDHAGEERLDFEDEDGWNPPADPFTRPIYPRRSIHIAALSARTASIHAGKGRSICVGSQKPGTTDARD